MDKINGIVRECKGEKAKVFLQRSSMCGDSCASCGMCGNKETLIWVDNKLNAKTNDNVEISIDTGLGLKASFLAYGIPVAIMFIGIIAISFLKISSGKGMATIIGAIILWYIIIAIADKTGRLNRFGAEICKIIKRDETNESK